MKHFFVFVVGALFLTACAQKLVYYGNLQTERFSYEATLTVLPSQERGYATVKLQSLSDQEVSLKGNVIDLVSPVGAYSIPFGPAEVSRFLLTKGQHATLQSKWRVINDPAFYQLYNLAGTNYPPEYTLNLGSITGEEDAFVKVLVKKQTYQRYQKTLQPILYQYKLSTPKGFEKVQKEHLRKEGWIVVDEHECGSECGTKCEEHGEEEKVLSSSFFDIGDHALLMNGGAFYVGFYAFAMGRSITLRMVFANREAEEVRVRLDKLTLFSGGKVVKPKLKKSSLRPQKGEYIVLRNQRGEWLVTYSLNQPAKHLDIRVDEAFVSRKGTPFFAVSSLGLSAHE